MKNFTKTVATFALVAFAAVSMEGMSAFAAEDAAQFPKCNRPAFSVNAETGEVNWKFGEMQNFIGREKIEMTEEEKAAQIENFKAKAAEKLAAGEITQEKYDEMIANMESGNVMPGKRGLKGMNGEKAKNFKMTEEEKAAQIENFKTKLAERLAAGEITQEKYDEIIANMESGNFMPIKQADATIKPKAPKMSGFAYNKKMREEK